MQISITECPHPGNRPGWSKTFKVTVEDPPTYRGYYFYVDTAVGNNCGTAVIRGYIWLLNGEKEFLEELKKELFKFFSKTPSIHRSPFLFKQMFIFDRSDRFVEFPVFAEVFKIEKVHTFQSCSEPGHTTSFFSLSLEP